MIGPVTGMMSRDDAGFVPKPVKPSSKCAVKLESMGITPVMTPEYDNVVEFVSTITKKIGSMDLEGIACIKRQVTLLKSAAGPARSPARIVLKQEAPRIESLIEKRVKQLESGRIGKLKMAAPREFKFVS